MLHTYSDVSFDHPILSVGYVIQRGERGQRELLETGVRVVNADAHPRPIDWDSMRGEYFAAITATRAALDYGTEPLVLCCDCADVAAMIRTGDDPFEDYFQHALFSFLERFNNYDIRVIHRENNQQAHNLARTGLKVARTMTTTYGENGVAVSMR